MKDNILVFDIETIPDIENGRKLYELSDDLSDKEVHSIMENKRLQKTGNAFLPHYLQRILVISIVIVKSSKTDSSPIQILSLGDETANEVQMLEQFFKGLEKYKPIIVSWNGNGFDLPVIHYRSLLHKISAPTYWDMGEFDRDTRYNNYISRYHFRHTDIMDILALYQGRGNAPLDELSQMLGFPGKQVLHGSEVWDAYLEGHIREIRQYCESDVLNTYLVYLRFQLFRGHITLKEYESEIQKIKAYLASGPDHFQGFLAAWKD